MFYALVAEQIIFYAALIWYNEKMVLANRLNISSYVSQNVIPRFQRMLYMSCLVLSLDLQANGPGPFEQESWLTN